MKKFPLLLAILCLLPPSSLWAQCRPTSAQICVAGDDTTQVWVNGSYVGQKIYCDSRSGCDPTKLCLPVPTDLFWGPVVSLALKTTNLNPVMVYSSWKLQIDCAGGKTFVVTNENPEKKGVTLYWDPSGGVSCGAGSPPLSDPEGHAWMEFAYNPFPNPFNRPGVVVTANTWSAAQLMDPLTRSVIPYISYDGGAAGSGPDQSCGTLYWRQVAALPPFIPTYTPTVFLTSSPTPSPTPTLTPWPTATPTKTWTHIFTFTPWPTSTITFTPRPRPAAVFRPTQAAHPLPTPQPVKIHKIKRGTLQTPPTPAYLWVPTKTPTPRPYLPPASVAPRPIIKPTPSAPAWLPPLEKSDPIVFGESPAEIYLTFGDGAGLYQLEVVDTRAKAVKVIYNQHVSARTSTWVEWDGKDSQGRDMPSGQYFVVFFLDGKPLRSISLVRSTSSP